MTDPTRRRFLGLLGAGLSWPLLAPLRPTPGGFRIRAITAGVSLAGGDDLGVIEEAVAFLEGSRDDLESDGYEVQTLRIAGQPLPDHLPDWRSDAALDAIEAIDRLVVERGVTGSIGPVITTDTYPEGIGDWAAALMDRTRDVSFSVHVASPAAGVHRRASRAAGEIIAAIARATPDGIGNFRFAATAFAPAGTPFFPAAWFDDGRSFSIGLESPLLLQESFTGATGIPEAMSRLRRRMEAGLQPLAERCRNLGDARGRRFLGIDVSPAPGLEASIGEAIEILTGSPFGSPSTLAACAAITDVLRGLDVETCGYSGLMLPVLEDRVLARRAAEGRYGVAELLLYSSVCGTGLDVVPLPGGTGPEQLGRLVHDVAALATKYGKPLSARLLPVPGKQVGDPVSLDNPFLTDSVVLDVG